MRQLLAVALIAVLASACSSGGSATELNVSAASSLTGAFTQIAREFEAANPGVRVNLNFDSSSSLAEQVKAGAPVDVFAAASPSTMGLAVESGNITNPQAFTGNTLGIAVPTSNPAQIIAYTDIAAPGTKLILCVPQAPCGTAAAAFFKNAGLAPTPVSQEPDVRSVLAKVVAGEADAGVVYVTDVRSAGDSVIGIEIPAEVNVYSEYLIGATTRNPDLATSFIEFVQSAPGQQVLNNAGFARR